MKGQTSTAAGKQPVFDADALAELERIVARIPPDPVAKMMRELGFDPDHGCKLVLADTPEMRELCGPWPGKYIQFSANTPENVAYMISPSGARKDFM